MLLASCSQLAPFLLLPLHSLVVPALLPACLVLAKLLVGLLLAYLMPAAALTHPLASLPPPPAHLLMAI